MSSDRGPAGPSPLARSLSILRKTRDWSSARPSEDPDYERAWRPAVQWALARHPAAIDHQVFTRDEGRLVGGEEQHGVGDVLRAAEPRQLRAGTAGVEPARLDRAARPAG